MIPLCLWYCFDSEVYADASVATHRLVPSFRN
jgi:hypothetical protein